jgi:transposase
VKGAPGPPIDWLRERTPQFRDAIEFVAIDPAAVYASAIRTPGLLPDAQIVVDHFHSSSSATTR